MLRVLNLTSAPRGIGGVERLLLDSVCRHDASRFEVHYCNLFCEADGYGPFPAGLRQRGARYHHVPGRGSLDVPGMVLRLARILRENRIDLLNIHMPHAVLVGLPAARLAHVPAVVFTRHYQVTPWLHSHPWLLTADRLLTRRADHVVAVSQAVRREVIAASRLEPSRVTVVLNGMDLKAFDAVAAAPDVPWPATWKGAWVLGMVANLRPEKGHDDLLRAFALLLRQRPDARLVLLGEGTERTRLQRLAQELGLLGTVCFAGLQHAVPALLRRFDVYVHAARAEPFGIAVLEAMAARKAIVATAVGGVPEILEHGRSGLLVPPMQPEALAAAMLQVGEDAGLAGRLADAARQEVERRFDLDRVIREYESLYLEVMGRCSTAVARPA